MRLKIKWGGRATSVMGITDSVNSSAVNLTDKKLSEMSSPILRPSASNHQVGLRVRYAVIDSVNFWVVNLTNHKWNEMLTPMAPDRRQQFG